MHTITVHCRPLCDANALLNLFGITRITKALINMHFYYTLAPLFGRSPLQRLWVHPPARHHLATTPSHPLIFTSFAHLAYRLAFVIYIMLSGPWKASSNRSPEAPPDCSPKDTCGCLKADRC